MIRCKLNRLIVTRNGKRYKHFLSSNEIRQRFIDYFVKENDHKFIKSSPVLPYNDPSIAFVNAGMCQFKNVFLGQQTLVAKCVANSQKCIRVGGRHNDLSLVGSDGTHHTFFEMLGNWSFGQYDKAVACRLAWNLLTSSPYDISPEHLYITVFNGDKQQNLEADDETYRIWKQLGIPDSRIIMSGRNDNFWEMGETGPCGPCTEIHIDYPPSGGKNLIELWNIVFIQYSREIDGAMQKLPKCFVDTGMGLERLAMVLQGKKSTYDTDLFLPLFDTIFKVSGVSKYTGCFETANTLDTNYRILVDHGRMITTALADNMLPSHNHKLRRIMRKSFLLTENNFKVQPAFGLMSSIANEVSNCLGDTYPEIRRNLEKVQQLLKHEYSVFDNLRKSVSKEWHYVIGRLPNLTVFNPYEECTGFVPACNYLVKHDDILQIPAFTMYDAFGLDVQTIEKLAKATDMPVDWNEFNDKLLALKSKTKHCIRNTSKINNLMHNFPATDDGLKYNIFCQDNQSYNISPAIPVKLLAVIDKNGIVIKEYNISEHNRDDVVSLIFDKTNFYCEAGGQENDIGIVKTKSGLVFHVINVEKIQENGVILHYIKSKDWPLLFGEEELFLQIDIDHRLGLMRSHSSVHILNAVLNSYLVVTCQTSSSVKKDLMSFTFELFGQKFTPEDALAVEQKINDIIKLALSVKRTTMSSNDLNEIDVKLIPGEIYPDAQVHVIDIYEDDSYFSREACCGTHVNSTSDLIDFCIVHYKSTNKECTLVGVTGPLCIRAKSYGVELLNKLIEIDKFVSLIYASNTTPSKIQQAVMEINDIKLELKKNLKKHIPLKNKIELDKKILSLERKFQNVFKEEKRKLLENDLRKLYDEKCVVGSVDVNDFYFNDNRINFDEVTRTYGDIPCLLFAYKNGIIFMYCHVPASYSDDDSWLINVFTMLKTKPIKLRNKGQLKIAELKIRMLDSCRAHKLIDTIVGNTKDYFKRNQAFETNCK
ncbi:alanine--tRNA ligase, mitochondrial-like [Adelges cooleyi]|uniref:alanine--tRNA ligase, mitochondrial-like n=1 Tax=Adelges cooleyi TaxID=133065 RepID=UPI0021803F2E|nr:alanine--tRNA ligase, mitochondrial-like [Adelges cooleyi]